MKLRPIDIPQADTLATVRQVVEATSRLDNPPQSKRSIPTF